MTKIDHIPYPDHNFWMKIDCCGIWFLTPMDFHVFYTFCTVFLYWPLQSPLWGPFRRKKLFFRKSIISPRDVGISTECSKKVRCIPKDIPNRWYGYQNDIRGKTPFFRFSGTWRNSLGPSSPPRLVQYIPVTRPYPKIAMFALKMTFCVHFQMAIARELCEISKNDKYEKCSKWCELFEKRIFR